MTVKPPPAPVLTVARVVAPLQVLVAQFHNTVTEVLVPNAEPVTIVLVPAAPLAGVRVIAGVPAAGAASALPDAKAVVNASAPSISRADSSLKGVSERRMCEAGADADARVSTHVLHL
jgi:hypothetical protein